MHFNAKTETYTRLILPVFILISVQVNLVAQEERVLTMQEEMLLETQASETEGEVDDDSYLVTLNEFRKHPLPINTADENIFRELRILTDLQIHQLISYRMLLGKLISIYELQAVPGWDLETIRKVLPYVVLNESEPVFKGIFSRLRSGNSNIIFRTSFVPQLSAGYLKADTGASGYTGSPLRLFARYQYNYKNLLQYGLLGDKDAGEQFFQGRQKMGFDFYSYHIFLRKMGMIQALALGDYTVSMGQGLIHWQSSGLRKNADAMMIKRQGPTLKPYRSAGEYNFNRGAGITLQRKRFSVTAFASYRQLSASMDRDENGEYVSSFVTSGYHRTELELQKRKNLVALAAGGVLKYNFRQGSFSLNTVHYKFQFPLRPQDKPYDLYGINADRWSNYSVDYSYTFRNIHSYGEVAIDAKRKLALLQGFLIALDRKLDFSIVYRNLNNAYQSMAGSSFTENSAPSNEKGLYAGFSLRPASGWVINIYSDVCDSPWLRFKTDAPARGRGYLLQVINTPNKRVEIYTRFSNEQKWLNVSGSLLAEPEIQFVTRKEWRLQFSTQFTRSVLFRSRAALSWYGEVGNQMPKKGFLGFSDLVWKPMTGIVSGSARLQYFDMDDYNTRIYAYENGPLYDTSIPAFFETGWRYYLNIHLEPVIHKWKFDGLDIWLKYGEIINQSVNSFGSGLDKINRSSRSEIKVQIMYAF
ncbi:hypothetical protein [Flavitalea sp.]|nr:hypothetical protein [Flavitalea sp.]